MPSKELIEKVAKTINGPFHPLPNGSPYTLDQLRDIRWQQINDAERKLCLSGAKAAISTILAALQEPTGKMEKAAFYSFEDDYGKLWHKMLNASPLGERE